VNRRDLCAEMLCNLEKEYGGLNGQHLTVLFESQVCGVNNDFTVNVATSSKSGKEKREYVQPYSLLVAGDGTNSVINQNLVDSKEIRCKRYLRNVGWKALKLPRQSSISPGFIPLKRGTTYGAMLPRFKDRVVLLMFWSKGQTNGQKNPFNANSPEKLRIELTDAFPNITVFPSDTVLQEFLDEPSGKETFLKVNKHASPDRHIALIGDAAVGMYSWLGQGVASSMQRASLLAETVCSSSSSDDNDQMSSLPEALRSFSDESVRQGHAITDLNLIFYAKSLPWIGRFAPGPGDPLLQNPDVPYSDIRKQYKGWVRLGRLLWFFNRVPISD
jgi:2-polyprenyl-6-methoxyphenol hydroxylase-like FAD-dependent oxidoreductase